MGFRCGIVGLPNVGKSTLFNALTAAEIAAENYPFCTIDPNVGIVPVNDPRLNKLADIVKPNQVIPTSMEFVDIAGLVAGASKGEGLGNKFLANIRETQAIAHVVRCFENENITHVAGKIDPITDIEVINTELALADLESVEKAIQKVQRNAKSGDKTAIFELSVFEKVKNHLDSGAPIRNMSLDEKEQATINRLHLLTTKPTLYIANVDETGLNGSDYARKVEEYAAKDGAACVTICSEIEAELVTLSEEERDEYLKELGLTETGLDRVIRAGHKLLGLQSYFTAGVKEVRAWTIPIGAKAPQAAGVIHTDFERGFIRAEVCSYEDFVQHNGEQGAKEAGKLRSEGKEYVVQDGDIIHFRFNV